MLALKSVISQGQTVPSATKTSSRVKRQGSQMQTPKGLVQSWCDHYTPLHRFLEPWVTRECKIDVISK